MSSRPIHRLGQVLALVILATAWNSLSPVYGDEHAMIEEAHHDLQQALNPGGNTPSAADQTALLNSALSNIKDLPPRYRGHRNLAIADIKSALHELSEGDPAKAANDIREADREVRILENW